MLYSRVGSRQQASRPFRQQSPLVASRWTTTTVYRYRCFRRSSGDAGDVTSSSLESAIHTVEECINIVKRQRVDDLLDYVPEEVLEGMLMDPKASETSTPTRLTFQGVLDRESSLLGSTSTSSVEPSRPSRRFHFDTYAVRNLVLSTPRTCDALSHLLVAPARSLHRYRCVSATGEEVVLTFAMALTEHLIPQYGSAPRIRRWWRLSAVTGEPDVGLDAEPLLAPVPTAGPEMVVEAQIQGLRANDAAAVFAFASAANRAATGPVERFAGMLRSAAYRPLLGHRHSTPIARWQAGAGKYFEAVLITAGGGADAENDKPEQLAYLWEVQLQGEGEPEANCWMTCAVQPIGMPQGLLP